MKLFVTLLSILDITSSKRFRQFIKIKASSIIPAIYGSMLAIHYLCAYIAIIMAVKRTTDIDVIWL